MVEKTENSLYWSAQLLDELKKTFISAESEINVTINIIIEFLEKGSLEHYHIN